MLKVVVISLPDCVERRTHMSEQLKELGIEFEFFDAVDGRKGEHPVLRRYDEPARLRKMGYPMRPGELGCFASHYLLWERCAKDNTPLLILEDDLGFSSDFAEVLAWLETHISRFGYIKLGGLFERAHWRLASACGDYLIVKQTKGSRGTQGYALAPETAREILSHSERWSEAVDDFLDHEWQHGVVSYTMTPSPLEHLQEIQSVIGNRQRSRLRLRAKARRELYQAKIRIRSFLFNSRYMLRFWLLGQH